MVNIPTRITAIRGILISIIKLKSFVPIYFFLKAVVVIKETI